MELCLDNPREGFSDLFATHPSVDARVQALVKFAGGHDPGPIALPSDTPDDQTQGTGDQAPPPLPKGPWNDATDPAGGALPAPTSGPWGSSTGSSAEPSSGPPSGPLSGPWGRH
jgi:heat shock protein HtpX